MVWFSAWQVRNYSVGCEAKRILFSSLKMGLRCASFMDDAFKELAVIFRPTEPQCAFETFAFVDSSLMPFHKL